MFLQFLLCVNVCWLALLSASLWFCIVFVLFDLLVCLLFIYAICCFGLDCLLALFYTYVFHFWFVCIITVSVCVFFVFVFVFFLVSNRFRGSSVFFLLFIFSMLF